MPERDRSPIVADKPYSAQRALDGSWQVVKKAGNDAQYVEYPYPSKERRTNKEARQFADRLNVAYEAGVKAGVQLALRLAADELLALSRRK